MEWQIIATGAIALLILYEYAKEDGESGDGGDGNGNGKGKGNGGGGKPPPTMKVLPPPPIRYPPHMKVLPSPPEHLIPHLKPLHYDPPPLKILPSPPEHLIPKLKPLKYQPPPLKVLPSPPEHLGPYHYKTLPFCQYWTQSGVCTNWDFNTPVCQYYAYDGDGYFPIHTYTPLRDSATNKIIDNPTMCAQYQSSWYSADGSISMQPMNVASSSQQFYMVNPPPQVK
jgi:hypothetical protein